MLVVNGLPKSGSHAVMAWLSRLGMRRHWGTVLAGGDGRPYLVGGQIEQLPRHAPGQFILAHVPARVELPWEQVVTAFRDPRNVLVSYTRHRLAREGVDVPLWKAIGDFWGEPFVPLARAYLGWRGRSVVVRYEDIPPALAGDGAGIYAGHDRDWNTRTGQPSDWRQVWCGRTEAAWQEAGGPELLRLSGY